MPSPRKGGTVPIRRGRKAKGRAVAPWGLGLGSPTLSRPSTASGSTPSPGGVGGANAGGSGSATFVVSGGADDCSSSSSWTDASDSDIRSSDGGGAARQSSSSSGSSSGGSAKSEDGSSGDDEDDDDVDKPRRKKRWRRKRQDGGGAGSPGSPRGRSSSRRGARKRGGSVLCRFCGRRGYGVMKMVFSCCSRQIRQDEGGFADLASLAVSTRPRVSSLSLPGPGRVGDDLAWASPRPSPGPPPPSPCLATSLRYSWSPTSSSSSSSTLSDSTVNGHSSGEEADVEGKDPSPRRQLRVLPEPVRLLHCGGHVSITHDVAVS